MKVLLVEDNSGDARLIEVLLAEEAPHFKITRASRLYDAIAIAKQSTCDAALLDLSLPDSQGVETVLALRRELPDLPVVVLSGLSNEEVALQALKFGAQDYLIKGRADGALIKRAILYAVERQRTRARALMADAAFEATDTGIMMIDRNFRVMRVNPAFVRLTGYAAEDVIGKNPDMLGDAEKTQFFLDGLWSSFDTAQGFEGEVWNKRPGGDVYAVWLRISTVRDEVGALGGYVVVLTDITHRKQAEAELMRQATRDTLTGLPNRGLFQRMVTDTVNRATISGTKCGLLFIDLDGFKGVNDEFGHDVGDEVLKETARRLRAALRAADDVARLAGDEFIVILNEVRGIKDAGKIAEKVVISLRQPYVFGDIVITGVSASIGVALCPDNAKTPDELIKAADDAMYRSKRQGKNRWHCADEDMPSSQGEDDDNDPLGGFI